MTKLSTEIINIGVGMQANICEIFSSVQGEGVYIGEPQVFIRFSGCPYDCPYCDTEVIAGKTFKLNGVEYSNPIDGNKLCEILLSNYGRGKYFHSYSFTGGEPLIHYDFIKEVVLRLKKETDVKFFLETSGLMTEPLKNMDGIFDIMSVDIKTHSDEVLNNLPKLLETVKSIKLSEVYFKVLYDESLSFEIMEYVAEQLGVYGIENSVIIQPVNSIISYERTEQIIKVFYNNGIKLRIIPQTHKILSIP